MDGYNDIIENLYNIILASYTNTSYSLYDNDNTMTNNNDNGNNAYTGYVTAGYNIHYDTGANSLFYDNIDNDFNTQDSSDNSNVNDVDNSNTSDADSSRYSYEEYIGQNETLNINYLEDPNYNEYESFNPLIDIESTGSYQEDIDFWRRYNGYNSFYYRYNYPYDNRNLLLDTIYFSINEMLNNDAFANNFITSELEDVKVVLTEEDFDKLCSIDDDLEIDEECGICIEKFDKKDIVKLHCNHIFHRECIKKWLCHQKTTCPICRQDTRDYLMKSANIY